MIRALIFDFDGLILDTESPPIDAWSAMHARAGLSFNRAEALRLIGHVDVPYDPWTAFPTDLDRGSLIEEHRALSRSILLKQPLLPGVRPCIEEARRLQLKLGVASNSSHKWVDGHLQRLGLFEFFAATRCRDDVANPKPDPSVYQLLLSALNVAPHEAIAFEDSHAGSLAAKRAGLWCVAVASPCTQDHDFTHADVQVESLAEIDLPALTQRFSG